MKIRVNGEETEVSPNETAGELLARMALADVRVALEVNREIVPRSQYAEFVLNEGDQVEVVRAIGGGSLGVQIKGEING